MPHPFRTVPSGVRGLGRGFGAVYRLETGTSREADTKLRVAEEQKGAGEPGPKEALPAPGAPQASRRCERRGCCKPQRRAQTAPNYFPGAASGPGARRQSHGAAARGPKPRPGTRARPRAPRRPRTLHRAGPRGHRQARAPPARTHSRARTPTARPTSATPRPPPRPAPALAAPAAAFPLAARRVTRGARPRPSSVTRRRRRWWGLVSSGDWQRRRRRRPELEPQRLRAGAGEGGGPVRDDSPDGVSPPSSAGFGFGGGGGTAHP